MHRARRIALASILGVLTQGCPKPTRSTQATDAAPSAPPTPSVATIPDAAPEPSVDPPEGASLYFVVIGTTPHRVYVARAGKALKGFVIEPRESAEPDLFTGELDDAHRFRLTSRIPVGSTAADRILVEGAFTRDGLQGTRRWMTNPVEVIAPAPFQALAPEERTFKGSFVGVLGERTRLRAKLQAADGDVRGVYRYTSSKADLSLAGTLDAASRRVTLAETNATGVLTGRFEGLVVSSRGLAGVWRSPDGERSLPFYLSGGDPYPDITPLPGGGRVVPQETYRATKDGRCVESTVYPELSGIAAPVAKTINREWRRRAYFGQSGEASERLTLEAIDERLRTPMADAACTVTSMDESRYNLVPLGKALVAIELAHYAQFDGISGNTWSDCGVSDLETGDFVEVQRALGDDGRRALGALVKASLHEMAVASKAADFDDVYHEVREDTPLCMTAEGVRVMIYGHRLWGPPPQVIPYAKVAPLLPAGKLRAGLTR
jgi:hypothetical protein